MNSNYTDDSGLGSVRSSSSSSDAAARILLLRGSSSINCFHSSSSTDRVQLPSVAIRLFIPEQDIETMLQLNQSDTIWNIKQCVLNTIATNLDDGINHGMYCPPVNGRAGKYLDEERCLGEYGLYDGTVLQLVQKKRLYRFTSFDRKKIKDFNTKTRRKKLIYYLKSGNLERAKRLLAKGLDPNFQDLVTGETPLTMAVDSKYTRDAIMILVEGGAILDYRNRLGLTSLHRAAQCGNKEAVQTLLEFGASPNYKDIRGLTPLYYSVCNDTDPRCTELLLSDYATLGTTDEAGWTELHQSCRQGRVQHLEHLIFYGCEVNTGNSSGNTPLHICALNNQVECARMLLFRGADKLICNYINQDAESLAVFSGFQLLAETIRQFSPKDVVLHKEAPRYNARRRLMTQSLWDSDDEEPDVFSLSDLSHTSPHSPGPTSEQCAGSQARRSEEDGGNQHISRSSISRKSCRSHEKSRSASRPSSRLAFEPEPEVKFPPQKNVTLMSCDAASQRSRARSRSRTALKQASKNKETKDRCSSVLPPSPSPGRKDFQATPSTDPVVSTQHKVPRSQFESESGQENQSVMMTRSYHHEVKNCHDQFDTNRTGHQVTNHSAPWCQKQNLSNDLLSRDNLHGRNEQFRRSSAGNLPVTRGISQGFHKQKDLSESPAHQPSEKDRGKSYQDPTHIRTTPWSADPAQPPPPPPRRLHHPDFSRTPDRGKSYHHDQTEDKRAQALPASPPQPPPRGTRPSGVDRISEREAMKFREEDERVASCRQTSNGLPFSGGERPRSHWMNGYPRSHTGNALQGGEPVHRGIGHVSVSSSNDQSVLSQSRKVQANPQSHPSMSSVQRTSPAPSPLPPFPETFPEPLQDYQPLLLLPPPPSNIQNFHRSPPPPSKSSSASQFQSQIAWKNRSMTSRDDVIVAPMTSRDDDVMVRGGGRVIGLTGATTEVQSALSLVLQKRRQALERL